MFKPPRFSTKMAPVWLAHLFFKMSHQKKKKSLEAYRNRNKFSRSYLMTCAQVKNPKTFCSVKWRNTIRSHWTESRSLSVFMFTLESPLLICVFHLLPAPYSSNRPEVPSTQHVSWKFHMNHNLYTDSKILEMHMFAFLSRGQHVTCCENNSCLRVFKL